MEARMKMNVCALPVTLIAAVSLMKWYRTHDIHKISFPAFYSCEQCVALYSGISHVRCHD